MPARGHGILRTRILILPPGPNTTLPKTHLVYASLPDDSADPSVARPLICDIYFW